MKRTQTERVLEASRSFRGVCQTDFLAPDVIDSGTPITRVCARIQDLEDKHNCVFEVIGWRNKTRVFRLVSQPGEEPWLAPTAAPAASLTEIIPGDGKPDKTAQAALFEVPPVSPYDVRDAA